MPSSHLIFYCSLLLLPSIPPSIKVFSNESVFHIRWPKYWSFSFNISPSNEYPGLISFRMDWLDLLAVQGTLKSLLQHRNSKAAILRRSAFFIVQLSHPYMTTGKTIALSRWTFAAKVMSLLSNMLSRLVVAFLPRSKRLLTCRIILTGEKSPRGAQRQMLQRCSATQMVPTLPPAPGPAGLPAREPCSQHKSEQSLGGGPQRPGAPHGGAGVSANPTCGLQPHTPRHFPTRSDWSQHSGENTGWAVTFL